MTKKIKFKSTFHYFKTFKLSKTRPNPLFSYEYSDPDPEKKQPGERDKLGYSTE